MRTIDLKSTFYRFLNEDAPIVRKDKYGNEIPKYGQGWGKDDSLSNRQGYNADGSKGPWFSRSVAVVTAVLLNENGSWFVLANQRGQGTPDYQGYWNLPAGYLDYNEEASEAATREIYEETGVKLNPSQIKFFGYSTSPDENRQNVCMFFTAVIQGNRVDFPFSKGHMEENEVDGIQWIPLERANEIQWAFDHDKFLEKVSTKYKNKIQKNNNNGSSVKELISTAISALQNGEDEEYVLDLLYKVSRLI